MSMIPDARSHLAGSHLVAELLVSWRAWPRAVTRGLRRQRDRAHLSELPDHLLRDIGIDRFDIASAVRFGRGDVGRRRRP
jgi:uncharacterized protein YjiS (DUF1127 family)